MVVMVPLPILKLSLTTLAMGPTQFVGARAKTIRGAGSVRDDVVFGGIVLLFVYAEHDGEVFVFRGSGDDDFFHGAAQMFPGVGGVGEAAGGLDRDLGSHGVPGQG